MSFNDYVAEYPLWIRLWLHWMTFAVALGSLVPLIFRGSRRDGLIVLGANVVAVVLMNLLFAQVGFVRLLGLAHIVVWLPLAIYLWRRLRGGAAMHRVAMIALWVFLATIVVSLGFDIVDVIRYIAGDRGPMV
jgi:hypothetical protein